MAINPQKLLPPSKLTTAERMAASYDKRVDDVLNFQIKEKLINVDKFFKKETKEKVKKVKKEKVKKERKKREQKEKDLETPKSIKGIDKVKSMFPKTGILDAIQRFATFTFLGYLLTKFGGETPKLLGILQKTAPVLNTVEKVIGGIFEGVVSFVDAGYKAYDQMRALSKDFGGEKAQKVYDQFGENLNRFLNAVLTFGLSELGRGNPEKKSGGGMVRGYQRGGQTTRGGKVVGGAVGRTFKAQRIQTPKKVQPEKVNPGKDVGGKLKIEKLYPNPKPDGNKRVPNPYKALTGVSNSLDKGGWVGALMAAGVKLALGQKVDSKRIASSVASGVGSLSQASYQSLGIVSRSILGMADGGMIPSLGSNTQIIGNLLATLIQSRVNEALKNVTDQLIKTDTATPEEEKGGSGAGGRGTSAGGGRGGGGGGGGGGLFEGKAADIPPEGKALLDAIAGSESSGYKSRFPSTSFSGFGDHPRIDEPIPWRPGYTSNAAGRYQFLSTTWDQYKPGKEFTPENQDIAAYRLAIAAYGYGEKGLIEALRKDPLAVANKLSRTWTSLPGGSEPNDATSGFLSRFQASTKKYRKPKQKVSTVFKAPTKETDSRSSVSPIFQYPTPESTTSPKIEKSRPQKISSLSQYPSYDNGGGMMVAVQPIIIEKSTPMPSGGSQTIAFPIPVGVNNNMASLSR
jgi:muramidase (phage lysozyme)